MHNQLHGRFKPGRRRCRSHPPAASVIAADNRVANDEGSDTRDAAITFSTTSLPPSNVTWLGEITLRS